ncbi:unnamed protein product [Ectocarpus sp. 12 AP-2014]
MEDEGHLHERRALFDVLGVSEDDGAYVLIAGLILAGLTFMACCYCKVYDPLRKWSIKTYNRCCKKQPNAAAPPPPEPATAEERRHWYLNQTLQIDRADRDELGPQGARTGLKGGWYGARNGGFDV